MALFGRRANEQSAKPEVPPELRPYYDGQSRAARLRHALGGLVPLIIAIVLAIAIIGGALWLRDHRKQTASTQKPATGSSQTRSQPATNQPGSTSNNSSSSNNQPSSNNNQAGNSQTGQQTTPSSQAPAASSPSTTDTQIATIPNTGPGDSALIITIAAAIAGTILYRLRLLRRLG